MDSEHLRAMIEILKTGKIDGVLIYKPIYDEKVWDHNSITMQEFLKLVYIYEIYRMNNYFTWRGYNQTGIFPNESNSLYNIEQCWLKSYNLWNREYRESIRFGYIARINSMEECSKISIVLNFKYLFVDRIEL